MDAGSAALDAAALEVLEALERLQQRQDLLGQQLRQGWLCLCQARFSLGSPRVSSLQYGATMEPRVRVLPRQGPGGALSFEEVPGAGGDPEEQLQEGGSELRQRRAPPRKEGAPARPPRDPLTWFGVLVPPSLRQAQGSFCQAVSLALEVAALQSRVAAAAEHYRHLLAGRGTAGGSQTDTEALGAALEHCCHLSAGGSTAGGSQTDTEAPGGTQGHDCHLPLGSGTTEGSDSQGDTEPPGATQAAGHREPT